jgi:hypothetical protein
MGVCFTMAEQREGQFGWLAWAVVWNDGEDEHIEYHDFADESKRDNPDVVVYSLGVVLNALIGRGFGNFHVWSDTCSNKFRSKYALHAVLVDLVDSVNESTNGIDFIAWNFFIPYHGKCLCDGHFAVLKRAIKAEANEKGSVAGLEEIMDTIDRRVSHTTTIVVPEEIPAIRRSGIRKIPDIKKFHSFVRDMESATLICKNFTNSPPEEWVRHSFSPYVVPKKRREEDDDDDGDDDEDGVLYDTLKSVLHGAKQFSGQVLSFLGAKFDDGMSETDVDDMCA